MVHGCNVSNELRITSRIGYSFYYRSLSLVDFGLPDRLSWREQPISSSDIFLQSGSMAFNAEVAETEKEKKRLLISEIPVWQGHLDWDLYRRDESVKENKAICLGLLSGL